MIGPSISGPPIPTFSLVPGFIALFSAGNDYDLMHPNIALSTQDNALPPSPDDVLDKLRDLSSPLYLQHDTAAIHIRAMALIGRLKSLYRAANTATRLKKDDTTEARQEMDQSHLNLQNLLYEKRHLEREIEKCRQFALVPLPLYCSTAGS